MKKSTRLTGYDDEKMNEDFKKKKDRVQKKLLKN